MKSLVSLFVMFGSFFALQVHIADAQSYPAKPVRIIVAQATGSSTDFISRVIGEALSQRLGQSVIVDPRPGAAGIIGTQAAARSAPDGYTLMLSFSDPNNVLVRNLPYDALKDFVPIALVADSPFVLVVNPSLPVKDLHGLIKLAKARPNEINFASTGIGSTQHLCGELLQLMAKIKMTHVPYQGGTPALVAVVAGEVSVMFPTAGLGLPHIRANKLRALAVTTKNRSKFLPDIPTIWEDGLPGFDMTSWFGLVAPAGTPETILKKLGAELAAVLKTSAVINALERQGIEALHGPPEKLTAYMKADLDKVSRIAKAAGIGTRTY